MFTEEGLFSLSRRCIVSSSSSLSYAQQIHALLRRAVVRALIIVVTFVSTNTHALLRRAVVRSTPRVRGRRKTVSSTHDEAVEKIGPLQREKRRLARVARKDDDGKRRHGSVRDARLETAHVRRPRRDGWIRPETVRREKRPQ